eukprot:TRINITY_DN8165_c0_g1_i2.p1 TRINITY_DN8165_c0_g1~~TRINITY_DN8165_c0_g1_i2.p1  ORF type:complete len:461 (-),score=119.94 TRINITY_DN8165_c0_g1_i2:37-1380(-)
MAEELRFEGQVVIVTGGGGGLGRAYALEFAKRGAKVVVNDLGTSVKGEGVSAKAADVVVEEIVKNGGEAFANYDSVTDGQKIVDAVMAHYGRIDVLINNAGILRDVSFAKMKDRDWNSVYQVHLKGGYSMSKAVWPVFRKQNYGRIIMTSSAAGLYGNFGQANYSAAKLGLLGFANTLSKEGAKRNIFTNTIAPVAGSRMTATVMPPELIKALCPEFVVPLVVYLCHKDTQENGGVFEIGAGFVAQIRRERTKGDYFRIDKPLSPTQIKNKWDKITDFTNPDHPSQITESTSAVMGNLGNKGAEADAREQAEQQQKTSGGKTAAPAGGSSVDASGFKAAPVMSALGEKLNKSLVKQVQGVYHFEVTDGPGGKSAVWCLDLKNGDGKVSLGKEIPADCTLTLSDDNFEQLFSGKLNAQQAFMQGKLKIGGNMSFAMKLGAVIKQNAKL